MSTDVDEAKNRLNYFNSKFIFLAVPLVSPLQRSQNELRILLLPLSRQKKVAFKIQNSF